jgi:hypothetical protein
MVVDRHLRITPEAIWSNRRRTCSSSAHRTKMDNVGTWIRPTITPADPEAIERSDSLCHVAFR